MNINTLAGEHSCIAAVQSHKATRGGNIGIEFEEIRATKNESVANRKRFFSIRLQCDLT